MRAGWVGAVLTAGLVLWFGWGLAGLVTVGCDWDPRGCGVPEGGGKYFTAFMAAPWPLGIILKTGFYRKDWRRTLGFPAGAFAGAAVALGMGTSSGHWVVASVLVLIGVLIPWLTRYTTEEAREVRRQERERRAREERRERARVRRRERRRERRRSRAAQRDAT
ncbi:hypothetical protein ACIQUZ_02780 [Streptomyces griseus]|uniref:hypothetical protein n=1 Tax=Streptomyces TaxID=1883 RepID=UPI00081B9FA5|nr:hypothetical protein [Streptomyces sp. OspMP-M43]SCE63240.1 hypothetical protein GA0115261_118641 [Streptomyces sp. OspMP-M43]